jgi:hypothetical protein
VQAPSSPSSHGHANTVHHPVTVPMSFFGYGKAKVPDVVQVQSQTSFFFFFFFMH